MANSLTRSSVVGSNKPVSTFTREGLELGLQPIFEQVMLKHIGSIGAGATKTFNLSNVDYPIKLNSIFIIDANATNDYVLTVSQAGTKINEWNFTKNEIPFALSDNVIDSSFDLTITPTNAITGVILYAQQTWLLEELSI